MKLYLLYSKCSSSSFLSTEHAQVPQITRQHEAPALEKIGGYNRAVNIYMSGRLISCVGVCFKGT